MPNESGFEKRERSRGKALLGFALVGPALMAPALAAAALVPATAAKEAAAAHQHASKAPGLADELARVRAATARFHRVDAAIAAGYELGWVNGAGPRIVTGCVANSAGTAAMGFHYFNRD